jgi:glutamine synthetase
MRERTNDPKYDEILDKVRANGVELIRFLYCNGIDNKIRGKSVQADSLASFIETGVGHPGALLCFNMIDLPVPGRTFTSVGEVRIVPVPETFAVIPYLPKVAYMFSDLLKLDQTPWEMCPRDFLKRMIKKAEERGIVVKAAIENEFYLTRKTESGFEPFDDSDCYASAGMDYPHIIIIDIIDALRKQSVRVEQFYSEYGGGQEEMTLVYDDVMRAADEQLIFRETVRGIAQKHGLYVSFAPKPFLEFAGNGSHIHLSLWDAKTGKNVFSDPNDKYSLSKPGYSFIGGVLRHARGLVALTAPSVNSYRRLQPERLSSAYVCYGPDNREATMRISSPFWGREAESINIEYRVADPSANPHIALGSLIAAGLDGVEKELDPGEPLLTDPAWLTEEERKAKGIERYPTTLDEALNELERNEVLLEALGPVFAKEFLLVKRADCELFKANDDDFEIKTHFYAY